jgi:hypothetical protein
MIRRRRHHREIPFSFDSFLDVVANVVGIIIRLILVVWVGARSYSSIQQAVSRQHSPAPEESAVMINDPLQRELDQRRQELARSQGRLLEQLRRLQGLRESQSALTSQLAQVDFQQRQQDQQEAVLAQKGNQADQARQTAALTLEQVHQRQKQLQEEINVLEKQPSAKKVLHYRTPVSRPVQADEYMFECKEGRVSYIDLPAMLTEIRQGLEDKGQLLRSRWEVSDVAGPVGAFQVRYRVERERDLVNTLAPDAAPDGQGNFRYGLSEWKVEPIAPRRGETADAALAPGSVFRQVTDRLDPHQAVVTFWVYADSFALYRKLRDYLYERDLVVAGRPLPDGVPISSSRRGTSSRGQ